MMQPKSLSIYIQTGRHASSSQDLASFCRQSKSYQDATILHCYQSLLAASLWNHKSFVETTSTPLHYYYYLPLPTWNHRNSSPPLHWSFSLRFLRASSPPRRWDLQLCPEQSMLIDACHIMVGDNFVLGGPPDVLCNFLSHYYSLTPLRLIFSAVKPPRCCRQHLWRLLRSRGLQSWRIRNRFIRRGRRLRLLGRSL